MSLRIQVVIIFIMSALIGHSQQAPLSFITTPTSTLVPGDSLDVEVRFSDFDELTGVNAYILWDSTVMVIDTIPFVDGTALGGFSRASISLPSQNNLNPEQGQMKIFWFSGGPVSIPDDTHLFTMRFFVVGEPCDTTSFSLGNVGTLPTQMTEILDTNFEVIGATINDDILEIPGSGCDMMTLQPVDFDFINVNTTAGSNICMPLIVTNFDSIDSFGGSVSWNPSQLSYTDVQNFGVAGFSTSDFGTINAATGSLTYTWIDNSGVSPETLSAGGTLFEVCFDAIAGAGTNSLVSLVDNPLAISATRAQPNPTNPNSIVLDVTSSPGSVIIPPDVVAQPVVFHLPEITAQPQDNRCLPITVDNFTNVNTVGASIMWDTDVLEFTGTQAYGLQNFNANNVNSNGAANGMLGFTWMDITGNLPTTLANGATILEVCFDVVGSSGSSSDINFVNAPIPVNATQPNPTIGQPNIQLETVLDNGSVTVNTPPQGGVTFIFSDTSADNGENICIPLTVNGFNNINSVNGSIMWDPNVLSYTGVGNTALTGLNPASNLNEAQTSTGMLGFSWLDLSGSTPITVPNGGNMIEICFDVIGSQSAISALKMIDNPTVFSVSEQPANPADPSIPLPFTQENGVFTVDNGPVTNTGVTFNYSDTSADNGENICIPLTVNGFTNINSVNGSIMWDPTVLSYTGVGNTALTGLNPASNLNQSQTANGMLGFSWLDLSGASPVTVPSGGNMLEICFDVIGDQSDTSVLKMIDTPTVISVSEQPANPADPSIQLPFTLENGTFTVDDGPVTAASVTFIYSDVSADNGENICIPLTVNGFTNINSVNGSIMWDASVLSYTGVGNTALTGLNPASNLNQSQTNNGMLGFSWLDLSGASPITIPTGGNMLEVCFDVVGTQSAVSTLKMTDSPTVISVSEQPANPSDPSIQLPFTLQNGTFTVTGGPPPATDVIFTLGTVSGDCGDNVCVPLTVEGFTNVNSVNGSIMWDASLISYTGLDNNALPGFSPSSNLNASQTSSGQLGFSWLDLSGASPLTIPSGGTLLEVCFEVIGMADNSSSDLEMTNSPTVISVSEQPANPSDPSIMLDFETVDGAFNIGTGCTIIVEVDSVEFIFPELCILPTQNSVCIPLTVNNFTRISQLDFSLMWDPAVLEFDNFDEVQLMPFNPAGQLNLSMVDQGRLSFLWFDDTGETPATFPDGSAILEVCFDVLGGDGDVSSVALFDGLSSGLTDIAVGQAGMTPSEPTVTIPHKLDPGSIEIKNIIVEDFYLSIDEAVVESNSELACVEINVTNFSDLIITEWNMVYDATQLCFNSIRNISAAVPTLNTSFFNTNTEGLIKLAWADPNRQGRTIPDEGTYYEVCFDVKMACDESTPLAVLVDPTQAAFFEVVNETNQTTPLPYDFDNGSVTVDCPSNTGLTFDGTPVLVEPRCANENNGTITQTFSGGCAPYNCSWTGPSGFSQSGSCNLTSTISNLAAGIYTLKITDCNGDMISENYTLNGPSPININETITNVNCDVNGMITFGSIITNPTGGTPPYTQTPANLNGLNAGTYVVRITDSRGCEVEERYDVVDNCVSAPLICSATSTPGNSCGENGTITTMVTGGAPPYSIFYSPAITSVTEVPPGPYTITCRDRNNQETTCTVIVEETQIANPFITVSNISGGNSCSGVGGSADIDISGGCPPVDCKLILILNGEETAPVSCSTSNNILPGTYIVRVCDAQNNIAERQFVIPDMGVSDLDVAIMTTDATCSYTEGTVDLQVSGGCAPYSLDIAPSDGAETPPILNVGSGQYTLPSGLYEVTVSDNSTMSSIVESFRISAPPEVEISIATTDNCVTTAQAVGGTAPYAFQWMNGTTEVSNTEILDLMDEVNNLPDTMSISNTYTIIVTDAAGCVFNFEETITCDGLVPTNEDCNDPLSWTQLVGTPTPCAGQQLCAGTVSGVINHCPDLGPYVISVVNIDTDERTTIIQDLLGSFTIAGLCEGSYRLETTDGDNADWILGSNIVIDAPDKLDISELVNDCDEENKGILELTTVGGIGAYTYSWSYLSNDFPGGAALENLESGSYFVTVTDANDCIESQVYSIDCTPLPPITESCDATPVITPGNDNLNENFVIECVDGNQELKLFDRWGKLIYRNLGYNNDWNGTLENGELAPEGAYYWVLMVEDENGSRIEKGTVTVLRNR